MTGARYKASVVVGYRELPKLTPERANFLRRRIRRLRREMLAAFVMGITLAIIVGYAAISWERSINPLDIGFTPAIADVSGILVAAPFMTTILVLRNRMNACLEELNAKKR
jgi:Mg/Co/Ni transporter MgtE